MVEPDAIAAAVTGPAVVAGMERSPLAGRKLMITAGPTREAIDPVRYLSNRSSGKMGFAMARAAVAAGAEVLLICGPVELPTPARVQRVDVESAADMYAATHEHIEGVDIFIAAAAVVGATCVLCGGLRRLRSRVLLWRRRRFALLNCGVRSTGSRDRLSVLR